MHAFAVLSLLVLCSCGSADDDEEQASQSKAAQATPAATECVAETYARDLCGPGVVGQVCNGTTSCTLVETIARRDERATPLPNQESIYWREHPAGPRYVYCCAK